MQGQRRYFGKRGLVVCWMALVSWSSKTAFAQSSNGAVRARCGDQTNSVIPGARLELTNRRPTTVLRTERMRRGCTCFHRDPR